MFLCRSGLSGCGQADADLTMRHCDLMAQDQISMSLAAALRASNPSQPNTVAEIKYSSLSGTARDHVPIQAPRKHQVTARVTTFGTVQGAELVIHGGDLRYRWAVVIRHDRPLWHYDCCI